MYRNYILTVCLLGLLLQPRVIKPLDIKFDIVETIFRIWNRMSKSSKKPGNKMISIACLLEDVGKNGYEYYYTDSKGED